MTKASLALLCLMVGVISAAEINFKNDRKSNHYCIIIILIKHFIRDYSIILLPNCLYLLSLVSSKLCFEIKIKNSSCEIGKGKDERKSSTATLAVRYNKTRTLPVGIGDDAERRTNT